MADESSGIWPKLLFAGALGVVALQVTGLRARTPVAVAVAARPAAHPAAPKPVPTAKPIDERFVLKRILEIDHPLRHGDYVWDDAGVPDGPIVITVDLAAEMLSVFRGGYEIGAAVILYGAPEKPTPLGVFPITQKDARHVSSIYGVSMPYTMRLTGDGVSIHGKSVIYNGGTSGCIGVPVPFAKKLFAQAKLGDKVIITRGKMMGLGEKITGA